MASVMVPKDDPLARLHGRCAFLLVYEDYWKKERNGVLPKVPRPSRAAIDLFSFFTAVQAQGGIDCVYQQRLFQPIAALLRLPVTATSCGFVLNKCYRQLLLPCEPQLLAATQDAYRALGMVEVRELDGTGPRPSGHVAKRTRRDSRGSASTASTVAVAVLQAGMPVCDMTGWERDLYPEQTDMPDMYLDVRNHILQLWHADPRRRVNLTETLGRLPPACHGLATSVFHTLQQHHKMNFGALPLEPKVEGSRAAHIVVIGAGIAGFGAARQLYSLGHKVTIVEAKDRLGGRCLSAWDKFGCPADLGAMLITGLQGNPLGTLCRQLDIELKLLRPECPLLDIDGRQVPLEPDHRVETQFNTVLESVNRERKQLMEDRSLGEEIRRHLETSASHDELHHRLLQWHMANLEYGCGVDLDKVSLLHWDQDDPYAFDGDHMLVCSGFGTVIKGLAQGLQDSIRLSTEAQRIDYSDDGVRVHVARNGSEEVIACDAVLVTVSLGVLKDGWMQFTPPLPTEKVEAIGRLGFGCLNKVALVFDAVFWPTDTDYVGLLQPPGRERGHCFMFWNMANAYRKPAHTWLLFVHCHGGHGGRL